MRVQDYYASAAQCERRAALVRDPEVQAVYRAMIRCWLDLARRAEWLEQREAILAGAVQAVLQGAALPLESARPPRR